MWSVDGAHRQEHAWFPLQLVGDWSRAYAGISALCFLSHDSIHTRTHAHAHRTVRRPVADLTHFTLHRDLVPHIVGSQSRLSSILFNGRPEQPVHLAGRPMTPFSMRETGSGPPAWARPTARARLVPQCWVGFLSLFLFLRPFFTRSSPSTLWSSPHAVTEIYCCIDCDPVHTL